MVAMPSRRSGWSSMLRTRIACAVLTATIIGPATPATARNVSGDVTRYGHAKWALRDGGLTGYPRSIVQTSDGFLWLATDFGLQRFDGVRFTSWEPPAGSSLPGVAVRLLATRDGGLWIGTDQGLARWNDGVLSTYRELDGEYVYTLAEDRNGAVWAGTNGGRDNARLCSIQGDTVDCDGDEGRLGRFVVALHEDEDGELWVGAATGLWRWGEAAPTQYSVAGPFSEINALVDDGARDDRGGHGPAARASRRWKARTASRSRRFRGGEADRAPARPPRRTLDRDTGQRTPPPRWSDASIRTRRRAVGHSRGRHLRKIAKETSGWRPSAVWIASATLPWEGSQPDRGCPTAPSCPCWRPPTATCG